MINRKDIFIEKARKVHAGENLDYSKVVYVNNRTPVEIIDHDLRPDGTEYGPFWQTPSNHLKGQRHPDKRGSRISASKKSKQEEIIERFKQAHKGENLDYSQVQYVNMHTKVKIISHDLRPDGTEYGEFWQEPVVHLKGCTHPDIGKEKQHTTLRYNTEKFVALARKVHAGEDYNYDKVEYTSSKTKVCICCNKLGANGKPHGEFMAYPDAFLQGKGCPKCGNHVSHAETEIADSLRGPLEIILRDKAVLRGKEIDIYVPEKHIGIEFDGLRWHSEAFKNDKWYHINKTKEAKEAGVTLIHVFEDEYRMRPGLVVDKLKNILGLNGNKPRVYARKCVIDRIEDKAVVSDFINKNHIQGYSSSSLAYGAYYNGALIAVMTFIKESDCWNLNRFCTDIRYCCPGVASRLFKRFVKDIRPRRVKSFLDRRWCFNDETNLYTKLGFKLVKTLSPDYRYTNGHGERCHKFGFRKNSLHKKYGLPLWMTEREMTEFLGYYKIWDCGLYRYEWTP